MTDKQYYTHKWLSRMWDANTEIDQLILRRSNIICSLSGIGKYDAEHIPAQTGGNATETKNLEYSLLSAQIEKLLNKLGKENVRTLQAIDQVNNTMLRGMLKARYINRLTWTQVGKLYNYERTQAFKYGKKALDAVAPFVPHEVIEGEC